jgi:outer membrane lipoprotein-sorting protein
LIQAIGVGARADSHHSSLITHHSISASDVLKSASVNYDVVKDYTVDAHVTVNSGPEQQVPDMNVTIFYKKPDKVHVESKDGFAMIPRKGFVMGNPLKGLAGLPDLKIERTQKIGSDECYVIAATVSGKRDDIKTEAWIDKKDWLVRRMALTSDWDQGAEINIDYIKVQARYWMPSKTSANLTTPQMRGHRPGIKKEMKPQSIGMKIEFSNYKVNTGLSDKLFQDPGGKK